MIDRFKTADGLDLAYDITGQGPDLLCLAGLTRNMDDFLPVVDQFAGIARVIRLDSRGRGASDFDPDFMNYSILQEANDALALMDHLGLNSVAVLGTSRGGLLAMTMNVLRPGCLSAVIFNDVGPVIDEAGLAFIGQYLGQPPAFGSMAEAEARLPTSMAKAGFSGVSKATWAAHCRALWREDNGKLALRYDPKLRDAVLAQTKGLNPPDLWPVFDALAALPLGLIRGENSNILSKDTYDEMRRRRPDMAGVDIPDRGHVPFLDEPEAVSVIQSVLDHLT